MRVFVAGASGAIGQPLIAELLRQGHTVIGMARPGPGAQKLLDLGAQVAEVNAFDADAVIQALRKFDTEAVIDELTSLPRDPANYGEAFPGDRKLRLEGGGNLHRAARENGIRRYIQQASGFFYRPGAGLADESESLAVNASPGIAAGAQMYTEIEARLATSAPMEGVALRYGFFYGPGTWYWPDGAVAAQVRAQGFPIVGQGQSVWSFVHTEDAAKATVAALTIPAGVYNIVDSDPLPVSEWLPEFARWVDAPPPPHVTEEAARAAAGEDALYYGVSLRGATNAKAKAAFGFAPRRQTWLKS